MSASLAHWRRAARARLQHALDLDLRQAHWELTALISHATHLDAARQELRSGSLLADRQRQQLDQLVAARAAGAPIAHLLGRQSFCGIELHCSPAALVPRPETELLVQFVLRHLAKPPAACADLGTGTGALAIALAKELPEMRIVAFEASRSACALARANINRCGLQQRIVLRNCSWELLEPGQHMLISNPPYVPSGWCKAARQRGLLSDPRAALDGGRDGLDSMRTICRLGAQVLVAGGLLFVEHGVGQHHAVAHIARHAGLRVSAWQRDYAGVKRFAALAKADA